MSGNGVRRTAALRRPAVERRSAMVVGEVRIYQELIRLAVERNRLLAEGKMWGQRFQDVSEKLAVADRYTEELQHRIGLAQKGPNSVPQAQRRPTPAEDSAGGTGRGIMELRYCPDK